MTAWIICQLGAREHYAIPRALQQSARLHTLVTDAWIPPRWPLRHLSNGKAKALCDRYHADLKDVPVQSFTRSLLSFEVRQQLRRTSGWRSIIARNTWFQYQATKTLKKLASQFKGGERPILFSYSYTARSLFQYAKQQGWRTVLGQIDPGPVEEQQVAEIQAHYQHTYASSWTSAPVDYWQQWQQECELADYILANSDWSRRSLVTTGIPDDKIKTVPLAYPVSSDAQQFERQYPDTFSFSRPLRVLFLGQIILRKGVAALLEALPHLKGHTVEIWMVGTTELILPPEIKTHPQIKWVGAVPRSEVKRYYQQADVFLFPTHSDGFGLTQLEAQSWRLPIIASRHCGEVVQSEHNGLVLSEVSGRAIAQTLLYCAQHPDRLQQWSESAVDMNSYSLNQLANTLQDIAHDII